MGPDNTIFLIQYISDSCWPSDLKLSLEQANWDEWSFQISILADRQGLTDYLAGTLSHPDKSSYPKAFQIWHLNDRSFRAFMFGKINI
jgi:hypothetical protein